MMYSNKVVLALFCKSGVIVMFSLQAPHVHKGHICDPTKSPKCISILNYWAIIKYRWQKSSTLTKGKCPMHEMDYIDNNTSNK